MSIARALIKPDRLFLQTPSGQQGLALAQRPDQLQCAQAAKHDWAAVIALAIGHCANALGRHALFEPWSVQCSLLTHGL